MKNEVQIYKIQYNFYIMLCVKENLFIKSES